MQRGARSAFRRIALMQRGARFFAENAPRGRLAGGPPRLLGGRQGYKIFRLLDSDCVEGEEEEVMRMRIRMNEDADGG